MGICSPQSLSGSKEKIDTMWSGSTNQHHLTLLPLSFLGKAAGGEEPGLFFSGVSPSLEVTIALSGSQLPWKQAALKGTSSPGSLSEGPSVSILLLPSNAVSCDQGTPQQIPQASGGQSSRSHSCSHGPVTPPAQLPTSTPFALYPLLLPLLESLCREPF